MKYYNLLQFIALKSTFFLKRTGVLLFSLLFTFQLSHGQIVGPGDWSSLRLYGHAFDLDDFSEEEYDWIANHFYYFTIEKRHARLIYGDVSSERASAATAAKIVENNSNTHPLFYWNTKVVYDAIYETIQPKIAENPQWSTSSTGGGSWTDVAYADPEFRTWFVDVVKDMVNNYAHDGVFLDAALSVGGFVGPTAAEYLRDMMAEMPGPTFFNGFGPNTPYARFDYLETTEGVFLEHFFKSQCNTLAKGKKMLDDLLLVPNDKVILANAGPESTFWNTTDHKFSLAAFLIIANDNSYYHWMPSPNNWSSDELMFWDDDFGQYIGPPVGIASVDGYVYTREFENASVTIDLENKTSSIIWGTAPDVNLALNGTAAQSKTLFGAKASRAIDDNTDENFRERSVSVAKGPYAWWEVDLGDTYRINDVVVFNPTNSWCGGKFTDFTVSVIDESGETTYSERITGVQDVSVPIDAQGVPGQTIRVQSNSFWLPLTLAEVQVFGKDFFKLRQVITFPDLPETEIGDADFDPGATASSGYSVSYTSSNTDVATIVDGKIRIVGIGTSEITASQGGDNFYDPALDVIRVLNVTKANFALNGTATQSTTIGGAEASRAIDGNTDGIFSRGSVTAAAGPNAWWQVELADSYSITEINVFNRTNCCQERLADFTVFVIDSSANITFEQNITTIPDPTVSIDAGGAIGNVVRIESNITATINLAEVQVFGDLLTSGTETSSREVSELVEKEELTERLVNNHLLVYPNPTSHMLNIEFKGDETTTRVEILNHKGQMMHAMNIHDSNSASVDISGLSRGLYIIRVSNQYEVLTRKIMKE